MEFRIFLVGKEWYNELYMDKIAIIIVHYDTVLDTDRCLVSLSKIKTSEDFDWQVFVVDNGSKIEYKLPTGIGNKVTLLRSATNLGFTGGNNLGFKYAKEEYNPDYFLLLNSDTTVAADFLIKLFDGFKKNERNLGILAPLIYFAPNHEYHSSAYNEEQIGKVIWYARGVVDWPNLSSFHQGVDEADCGQYNFAPPKPDFVSGCCFLIKRQVLEIVGGFDDKYFLYFEDADLSLRVKKAGYEMKLIPDAYVWHYNGGSSGGVGSDLQNYYLTRNRLLFNWRHGSWKIRLTVLRLTVQFLLNKNKVLRKAAWHFISGNYGKQIYV